MVSGLTTRSHLTTKTRVTFNGVHFEMTRSADIDHVNNYRYELRRLWDAEKDSMVVIGLNPSTADALQDDATIRVLIHYAHRLGMGSLVMLNLFAWRATQPEDLIKASKDHDVVGPHNSFNDIWTRIKRADALKNGTGNALVWAAWGKFGKERGLEFARFMGSPWCTQYLKCFAVNKDGSPHHPLHLRMHGNISPYTIDASLFAR